MLRSKMPCPRWPGIWMIWRTQVFFNSFQPSVAFHIETSHWVCSPNQITSFYVNPGLNPCPFLVRQTTTINQKLVKMSLRFLIFWKCEHGQPEIVTLHEKCPNTELFLVRISCIQSEYWNIRTRKTPYLDTFHAVYISLTKN